MQPWVAVLITAGVVALAAAIGAVWRATRGRRRAGDGTTFGPGDLPGLDAVTADATIVQFSTEFCSTCPATRRFLRHLARERDGVAYVDVDLTHRPELAGRLRILQTPTVFVLDRGGRLVGRFGGPPRRDELGAVLDSLVPTPEWNL